MFKGSSKWRTNNPKYPFLQLIQYIHIATGSTSPDMATVFHAKWYDIFIKIKSSLRRKNLIERIKQFFCSGDKVTASIQFTRETQSQHLKDGFFFLERTHPFSHHWWHNYLKCQIKQVEFFKKWIHEPLTVVLSAQIPILLIALSGRLSMHSWKDIGPRLRNTNINWEFLQGLPIQNQAKLSITQK